MHLAWRWFTGRGFDQEIPHRSTFSKNRHGRFQESKLFEQLFEQIVRQCVEVGLVQRKHLSVDGSFVEANASKESRIPREQLAEAAQVHQTVRQYLQEVQEQDPVEEPVHTQDQGSTMSNLKIIFAAISAIALFLYGCHCQRCSARFTATPVRLSRIEFHS